MSVDWRVTTLGAICRFTSGSAFQTKYQGQTSGEYPFIKVSDMNLAGNEYVIRFANNYVSESQRKVMKAKLHPIGATVFAKIGVALTTNRRRMLVRPTIIDNNMMSATAIESEVTPRFLYLLLTALDFNTISSGSALPYLNVSDLQKIEVTIPDLKTQHLIVSAIGDLEDKIDLNRQINQTLEQVAQTIFKSWFVDFEPVKAKIEAKAAGRDPERAAMCAISGKLDPELDQLPPEQYQQLAATAALFPDELVESELGLIPEGWVVKSIADISTFAIGKVEVSTLSIENYISTENMSENRGGVSCATSLPTISTVPSFSKGQVLISNIRPYFKKIWLARFDGGRSNDVLAFNATENDCAEFLYNLLYQDEFFEFMMRTSKGAKMPRGDKGAIAGWKFPCADHSLRSFFADKVRPYYSHIEILNAEVQHLALIRDTLLPKLLSGELAVESLPLEATA